MLRSAISLRTAAQRRSSSFMEMGVSTRSIAAIMTSFAELWSKLHDETHALGLAVHERAQIVDEERHHLLGIVLAHAADVGGDHDVGRVPERAFGRQRLLLKNIEPSAGDASGRERRL